MLLTSVNIIGWRQVLGVFVALIAFDLLKFILQIILAPKYTHTVKVLKKDELKDFLTALSDSELYKKEKDDNEDTTRNKEEK